MRPSLPAVAAATALATPSVIAQNNGPTSNLTAAQVVANIQTLNAGTRTFSAAFSQTYLAHAYNTTKTSYGSVVISGLRSDWSYAAPAGQRIVSNATDVCVYQRAANQIYIQSAAESHYAAMALLTQNNLGSYFTFTLAGPLSGWPNGGYILVGTPIQPTSAYTKVIVFVDTQTFEIGRVMFLDGQQNQNRFDFTSVRRNAPNVNATFSISVPPNATVVAASGKTSTPPTCP